MCKCKFFVLVGNLKKNVFRSLKSLFSTSWLVLIFASEWHHVFKTFLDHVHLHWVSKTTLNVVFLHKIFRFLKFKIFIVRPIKTISFCVQNSLPLSMDAWSMFDLSKLENFQFLDSWSISFFMRHLYLDSHALHYFLYLSCIFAVISLID